jgi:hypothetical protein
MRDPASGVGALYTSLGAESPKVRHADSARRFSMSEFLTVLRCRPAKASPDRRYPIVIINKKSCGTRFASGECVRDAVSEGAGMKRMLLAAAVLAAVPLLWTSAASAGTGGTGRLQRAQFLASRRDGQCHRHVRVRMQLLVAGHSQFGASPFPNWIGPVIGTDPFLDLDAAVTHIEALAADTLTLTLKDTSFAATGRQSVIAYLPAYALRRKLWHDDRQP